MSEEVKIRYGAGGAVYYEKVAPKKQVISEIAEDEVKEKKPDTKKKKKVIQERCPEQNWALAREVILQP